MKRKLAIIIAITVLTFAFTGCRYFNTESESMKINSNNKGNKSSSTFDYKFSDQNDVKILTIDMHDKGDVLFKYNSFVKTGEVCFTLQTEEGKIMFEDSGRRFSFNETFSLEEGVYKILIDIIDAENGNIKLETHSDVFFKYYNDLDGEKDDKDSKE